MVFYATIFWNKGDVGKKEIRVPNWAKYVIVNGEKLENQNRVCVKKTWEGIESFKVEFCDEPHFVERPNDLYVVEYGALVFSLPIKVKPVMY